MTRPVSLAVALATLLSCRPAPKPVPVAVVEFLVESDPGQRLAGVSVYLDGLPVGKTDAVGSLSARVPTRSASPLRLEHDCPVGHEAPSEPKLLRLRPLDGLNASEASSLQITLGCKPTQRRAVFIVRAPNGADLPVLLDGEPVTRTNSSGLAHFSISAAPGTDFLVQLDTGSRSDLLPKRPSHLRSLADTDRIFLIDQPFERRRTPRRKRNPPSRITKIE